MIHGHKPSSYFVTADGEGNKIEGECRQCCHCQYTWEYRPGSGIERGYCLTCSGFLCARAECILQQKRLVDLMRERHNVTRSCVPYEEWNNRLVEKFAHKFPLDPNLTVTESGVIVPKGVMNGG